MLSQRIATTSERTLK
uniref:Uncharacterized protein n=3 Tax=Ralstonia solanacearum species complex TaxID=3116862 RepID=A0A0S4XBS6_RALSL|nr:protein of unknown function [Ralstonia solanacearum]CUV32829.1 protein of unknown function [Ralstonia solanacearum]CUV38523.1 protein of unknown function [Ralstonia solanacearum]CUV47282.1 protein of unknown function [Ralstonia solanacearum]CUV57125.1 protein of unknown function [Ralstonia solanacearum]